jgi:hypothetical protein
MKIILNKHAREYFRSQGFKLEEPPKLDIKVGFYKTILMKEIIQVVHVNEEVVTFANCLGETNREAAEMSLSCCEYLGPVWPILNVLEGGYGKK